MVRVLGEHITVLLIASHPPVVESFTFRVLMVVILPKHLCEEVVNFFCVLPDPSEQYVDRNVEHAGKRHELGDVRHPGVVFPAADCLIGHADHLRKLFLRQVSVFAQSSDDLSHGFAHHIVSFPK